MLSPVSGAALPLNSVDSFFSFNSFEVGDLRIMTSILFTFQWNFTDFYNCKLQTSPLTWVFPCFSLPSQYRLEYSATYWVVSGVPQAHTSQLLQTESVSSPKPLLFRYILIWWRTPPLLRAEAEIWVVLNCIPFLTIPILPMEKFCGFLSLSSFDWVSTSVSLLLLP